MVVNFLINMTRKRHVYCLILRLVNQKTDEPQDKIRLKSVAIPVSRNYRRLSTFGFDPPSDGYDKDMAYELRITAYDLRLRVSPKTLSTVFPEKILIEDI